MVSKKFISYNEKQTHNFTREIAANIKAGDTITLEGDLGAGKSFFCREFIKYWCGDKINVTSPTFNLLQTYEARDFVIYHYDLYRLNHISELYELNFEEALSDNVALIEWPELAYPILPNNIINIKISILNNSTRKFLLSRA